MGCFASTCMVSNIGIGYNDPIVMLRIAKRVPARNSGFSWRDTPGVNMLYPGEEWAPIGLPFFGSYDDYGRIGNVGETPNVLFTRDLLSKYRAAHEEGADPYTIEDLCDREIDGQVIDIDDTPHIIARTFILWRIWEHLTEEMEYEGYDREAGKFVTHKGSDRMRSLLRKAIDSLKLGEERFKRLDLAAGSPELMDAFRDIDTYKLRDLVRGGEGERDYGGMALYEHDPDLFLAEFPVIMALRASMMMMRRSFLPVQTIGEQHDDYRRQKRFFEVCLETIAPTLAEMDAEEEGDAEESTA